MSRYSALRATGLTNAESEDLGAIAMGKRLSPAPFCYSPKCTSKRGRLSVRKFVSGYPTDCPDCGWTLRWNKVRIEFNSTNQTAD